MDQRLVDEYHTLSHQIEGQVASKNHPDRPFQNIYAYNTVLNAEERMAELRGELDLSHNEIMELPSWLNAKVAKKR